MMADECLAQPSLSLDYGSGTDGSPQVIPPTPPSERSRFSRRLFTGGMRRENGFDTPPRWMTNEGGIQTSTPDPRSFGGRNSTTLSTAGGSSTSGRSSHNSTIGSIGSPLSVQSGSSSSDKCKLKIIHNNNDC